MQQDVRSIIILVYSLHHRKNIILTLAHNKRKEICTLLFLFVTCVDRTKTNDYTIKLYACIICKDARWGGPPRQPSGLLAPPTHMRPQPNPLR
jgi:hypothetical protein